MKEKANYGNWVPEKALYMLFGAAVILGVIAVIAQAGFHKPVIAVIVGVIGVLVLAEAVYMLICHETFAFGKGNMMAGVHEHLVKHLDWNGEGTLLDIGCGAATLTVRCAKAFPKAQITAMDYWGVEWSYAKEQCEKNARIEGVSNHISFQDMFSQKALYGDMEQFIRELLAEGISEVHYIGNLEKKLDFIPGFVTTPWMISGMGIIYGRK